MTVQYRNTFTSYNTLVDFDLFSSKSLIRSLNTNIVKYYTILINCIILLYGVFLGATTALSWNSLVSKWTASLLIGRIVFFFVFVFDFIFILFNSRLFKNYGRVKIAIDFLLLLVDLTIIVHLIVLLVFRNELQTLGPDSSLNGLNTSLRILFCLSVFRLTKLCFHFKPLLNLSQGIFLTIRSLVWTGVFVALVIYSCSIVTTWLLNDVEDGEMDILWGSLPKSMYTLFTVLTLEGWDNVSRNTATFYPNSRFFFVAYVSFTTLTVMNVVTGIILDTFISASEELYAENFYKGTYKRHADVSKLVNIALKKMRYPPLRVDEYQKRSWRILGEDSDRRRRSIDTYKRYLLNLLQRRKKRNEYKRNLSKFEDLQARAHFEKKYVSSFETKSSDDHTRSYLRPDPHSGLNVNRSISLDNLDRTVHVNVDNGSLSSPNVLEYQLSMPEGQTFSERSSEAGDRAKFVTQFKKYSSLEDGSRTYGGFVVSQESDGFEEVIDMDYNDPSTIINDSIMDEALRVANISKYHAYDVLNLYYSNGFRKVLVSEFAASCSRVSGSATNRELLAFELAIRRRLDNVDQSIGRLNEKLDRIITSVDKN